MTSLDEISVFEADGPDQIMDQIIERYLRVRPRATKHDELDMIHRELITIQPVVRNSMYRRLLEGRMTQIQYQTFFSEYNQSSQKFFYRSVLPSALEAHESKIWKEYIRYIIAAESIPKPHYELFQDFMNSCDIYMQEPKEPARKYSENLLAGYVSDLRFAAGYALGVEVEAGYEIAVLSKGLAHHYQRQLEQTDWFNVHLGDGQEDDHAMKSLELAETLAEDRKDIAAIQEGFLQYCDDVNAFMESVSHLIDEEAASKTRGLM